MLYSAFHIVGALGHIAIGLVMAPFLLLLLYYVIVIAAMPVVAMMLPIMLAARELSQMFDITPRSAFFIVYMGIGVGGPLVAMAVLAWWEIWHDSRAAKGMRQ
jgi:hypothetical protein